MDSWGAARDALLFGEDLDVLDCEGRGAGHELFIEQLGDKARFTMGTCPVEDLVSLVLGYFTEEDQEITTCYLRVWQRECGRGAWVPNQRTLPCPIFCGMNDNALVATLWRVTRVVPTVRRRAWLA